LLLLLNFPPEEVDALPQETLHRLTRINTIPCARVPMSFDDAAQYLQRLSKNARKDLRRKMRDAGSVRFVDTRTPDDDAIDSIYTLYRQTVDRADLSLGIHGRSFFARSASRCRTRVMCSTSWGAHDRFNLLIESRDCLVDKYFGMDSPRRDANLYFVS